MIGQVISKVRSTALNKMHFLSFSSGTDSYKKEIIISFAARGFNLFATLTLLPLSLKLLTTQEYGVWVTIYALNAWVGLFDLGTQNTLRNLLVESFVLKKRRILHTLLITNSFFFSLMICILLTILGLLGFWCGDFSKLLKIQNLGKDYVNEIILLSVMVFALKLVSNNFNAILMALQKTYITLFVALGSNLVAIIILLYFHFMELKISLLGYSYVILISDILISILFPLFYLKKVGFVFNFKPKYISSKYFKKYLFKSNSKFFVISLLVVFVFFSNNLFVGLMLSYEDVSSYNLVSKYFNAITMISVVALNPIWTQASKLYLDNNLGDIRRLLKRMYLYFLFFIGIVIVLVCFSNFSYHLLSSNKITIALLVSITAAVSTLQLLFNNIHAYILNGMNKINIQIAGFLVAALLILPCYNLFIYKMQLGILGAFLVQVVVFLPNSFLFPIVLRRYLKPPDKRIV